MNADHHHSGDRLAWALALGIAALTVVYRLVPYYGLGPQQSVMWNLMPVGALALFAGSRLRCAWAVLVPLAAMLLSDLLLIAPLAAQKRAAFSWGTPFIYLSFSLYFAIGRLIQRDNFSPLATLLGGLAGSTQFFLITNFLAWRGKFLPYTDDLAGLIDCYVKAIPFHQNTLMADLVFSLCFFGAHLLLLVAMTWGERSRERLPA